MSSIVDVLAFCRDLTGGMPADTAKNAQMAIMSLAGHLPPTTEVEGLDLASLREQWLAADRERTRATAQTYESRARTAIRHFQAWSNGQGWRFPQRRSLKIRRAVRQVEARDQRVADEVQRVERGYERQLVRELAETRVRLNEVEAMLVEARDPEEKRDDGTRVRKDRWERGLRTIASIVGVDGKAGNRGGWEIEQVVEAVRVLASTSIAVEPVQSAESQEKT